MKNRSAIVFDLDGTLVDSRLDLAAAVSFVLRELGHPQLPPETIVSHVGRGARHLVKSCLPSPFAEDEGAVDEAFGLFMTTYASSLAERTEPYRGVPEALESLVRMGASVWILTNKPGFMARELVERLGLDSLFEGVVGAGDVPSHKPDPTGLLTVCEQLGLAPSLVWYVGDMTLDVETARAAGCRAAVVSWGYEQRDVLREAAPDRILDSPDELLSLVSD